MREGHRGKGGGVYELELLIGSALRDRNPLNDKI